jgi:hypothetical protein
MASSEWEKSLTNDVKREVTTLAGGYPQFAKLLLGIHGKPSHYRLRVPSRLQCLIKLYPIFQTCIEPTRQKLHSPLCTTNAAGLFWGVVYYLLLSIEMVYAKRVVADVKLTTYGRVLYTNLLASVPCGMNHSKPFSSALDKAWSGFSIAK